MKKPKTRGFTLIELLVVIAIISILAGILFVGLSSVRSKARDARRAADIDQIYKALVIYYLEYGCLPTTSGSTCGPAYGTYSDANSGGWDYSSQPVANPTFLSFLPTAGIFSTVPVDPVNNMTGNGTPSGTYAYRYFCYLSTSTNPGLHLGYWPEKGGYVRKHAAAWTDPGFVCK